MSIGYRVSITDNATPEVRRLVERVTEGNRVAGGALEAMGARVVDAMQRNFEALPPNRMFPGRTTNFWKWAARSTNYQVDGLGVTVAVNQIGVRQRFYGGAIAAVNRKYLTIPARAEAYGRSALEFAGLKVVKFRSGTLALVVGDSGVEQATRTKMVRVKGAGKKAAGTVMFWLKAAVTQRPDPNVIPGEEQLKAAAVQGLQEYFAQEG